MFIWSSLSSRQWCILVAIFVSPCLSAFHSAALAQVPQPANDFFDQAQELAGYSIEAGANNASATREAGEPLPPISAGRSLWWRWTAPADGIAEVKITDTQQIYWLSAYTGSTLTELELVEGWSYGAEQRWLIPVQRGETYHFAVDNLAGTGGSFKLELDLKTLLLVNPAPAEPPLPPDQLPAVLTAPGLIELEWTATEPADWQSLTLWIDGTAAGITASEPIQFEWNPTSTGPHRFWVTGITQNGEVRQSLIYSVDLLPRNDAFADPALVSSTATRQTFSGDTSRASREPDEPSHGQPAPSRSLWWRWSPAYSGLAKLRLLDRRPRTALAVYTGSGLAQLSPVALNSASNLSWPDSVEFQVEAGINYRIAVDDYYDARGGSVRWDLELVTLAILSPAEGQSVPFGAPTTIRVQDSNTAQPVAAVAFAVDGQLVGEVQDAPFAFDWIPQTLGPARLETRGTNDLGIVLHAPPVDVIVRPANDHWEWASSIAPATGVTLLSGQTAFASAQPDEPGHGREAAQTSLWWRWTPPYSGTARLVMQSDSDRLGLGAYKGSSLQELQPLAESAFDGTWDAGTARMEWRVEAGETYSIAIDGDFATADGNFEWQLELKTLLLAPLEGPFLTGQVIPISASDFGAADYSKVELILDGSVLVAWTEEPFTLDWTPNVPGHHRIHLRATLADGSEILSPELEFTVRPRNDDFASPMALIETEDGWEASGNALHSTYEPGEPPQRHNSARGSIWFEWTAPFTGRPTVVFEQDGNHLPLSVFRGKQLDQLTFLAQGYLNFQPVPFTAVEGATYKIACYWIDGGSGPVRLTIPKPPVNDHFADATVLEGLSPELSSPNHSASIEPWERENPLLANFTDFGSLWWRWTAPATADVLLMMNESTCDVMGGVFTQTEAGELVPVAAPRQLVDLRGSGSSGSRTGMRFRVWKDTSYWFVFGSPNGSDRPYGTLNGALTLEVIAEPPENDLFENRFFATGLTTTLQGDSANSSIEAGEPDHGHQSVWWEYEAPASGLLKMQLTSGREHVRIAPYRGNTISELELLTFAPNPSAQLEVVQGDRLMIALVSYGVFSGGPYAASLELIPLPVNDSFADREPAPPGSVTLTGLNTLAVRDPSDPLLDGNASGKPLWWEWKAPAIGFLTLTDRNSFQSITAIYAGSPQNLELLSSTKSRHARLHLMLEAGAVLYIGVDGLDGQHGPVEIHLEFEPLRQAINDDFADAILLDNFTPPAFSNIGAGREPGEPQHRGSESGRSLWWQWQAPEHGTANARVQFLTIEGPATVAVYEGDRLQNLRLARKGENKTTFLAIGGTTYWIAIETAEEQAGLLYPVVFQEPSQRSFQIPGNIVRNGSFESLSDPFQPAMWSLKGSVSLVANERGRVDGVNSVVLASDAQLSQALPTIPDALYRIQFAYAPEQEQSGHDRAADVFFAGQRIGTVEHGQGFGPWRWATFEAKAISSEENLIIRSSSTLLGIDDVRVIQLTSPPSVLQQPTPAIAFQGDAVRFFTELQGSPPLQVQWYHNDEPVPGATGFMLLLPEIGQAQTGLYHAVVSNQFGTVKTAPARLQLRPVPKQPVLLFQPESRSVYHGEYVTLSAVAAGEEPMTYQWFRDGEPLEGATDRSLIFPSADASIAGAYTLLITNPHGQLTTSQTFIEVSEPLPAPMAEVHFHTGFSVAFDVDGSSLVEGGPFLAQLYAGRDREDLRAAGAPIRIGQGNITGALDGPVVSVPNLFGGETAAVQVRIWNAGRAVSYEEARAIGSAFGRSEILHVMTIDERISPASPPPNLESLPAFRLQSGLMNFSTGYLVPVISSSPLAEWRLHARPGFLYQLQSSSDLKQWTPFLVRSNHSGITQFVSPNTGPAERQFIRSRILD